ncbi:unnamed protein product [Rodentolepis nana]|uniref:SAM domain-containing protein n=1 Tax=Rodentolepis nana TaxID=102285 RepID=A0A0R3THY1_RODNA|nr:unnamed protein product [Rodentolepis nana]
MESKQNNFTKVKKLNAPTSTDFEEWPTDAVCDFLRQLGLDYCLAAARSWIKTGADLINANNVQIQQNLGPLKPLHLKKLLIHVSLRTTQDLMSTRDTAFLPSINPHPDFNVCGKVVGFVIDECKHCLLRTYYEQTNASYHFN